MAYATRFAFDHVWSLYHETQKQIRAGNLSMLPQVKAIFFALKLIVERFKDHCYLLICSFRCFCLLTFAFSG